MKNATWEQQLDRIFRYSERFLRLVHKHEQRFERDAHEFIDDIYASFIVCHSMKDWVKNDPKLNIGSHDVERFVTDTPVLAICADIANGTKHLICDPKRKGTEDFRSGAKPDIKYSVSVEYQSDSDEDDFSVEFVRQSDCDAKSADEANEVKSRWLKCDCDPNNIFIQIWVDIEQVPYDFGLPDLLWDVHELWRGFVMARATSKN